MEVDNTVCKTDINVCPPDNNLKSIYQGFKNNAKFTDKMKIHIDDNLEGKNVAPNKYAVYNNSSFGKISRDHSFTSEAAFDQILIFLLKSGYLPDQDKLNLLSTNFLFKHLERIIHWSKKVEFMDIRNPIIDYANQSEIDIERQKNS